MQGYTACIKLCYLCRAFYGAGQTFENENNRLKGFFFLAEVKQAANAQV